jgi:hypothetical protein
VDEGLTLVLQLAEETLVAVVDILRVLELLYRVNADVEVLALDVVLIELRQFDDTTELALDPAGRPLRVLFGEIARSERRSWWYAHGSCGAFGLVEGAYPGDLLICLTDAGRGKSRVPRRPRFQVEASMSVLDEEGGGTGALRPMRRLDTLLAVVAIAWAGDKSRDAGGEASSTGEIRPAAMAAFASAVALFLPKLSFHFDGFLVTGGRVEVTGGEAAGGSEWPVSNALGIAYIRAGSKGFLTRDEDVLVEADRWDDDLDAMLISRARD